MSSTSSVGGTGDLSSLLNALGANSSGSASGSSSSSSAGGAISAAGIGSGLDVDSIVTALVNARKAPAQNQIDANTTAANNQLNGLNSLQTAMAALDTALAKLTNSSTYSSYTATLSDTTIGTTSTLTSAVPGNYKVVVSQLATAQKRTSAVYGTKDAVGAGSLNITVAGKSMNLNVSATATMADIASAINSNADNPGVTATVVNGANGSQLLLSSSKTGVANAFTVGAGAGSSDGLSALASTLNTAGDNEAVDAKLTIDNIPVTSASNSVSGALDGVTLNLTATGTTSLTVAQDTSTISDAVSAFVDAYNSYNSTVTTLDGYDADTGVAGVLLGDPTLNAVKRQIGAVMSGVVNGNSIGTLANLGITRDATGNLTLDKDKLTTALTANPGAVQGLFVGTNGYASKLQTAVESFTASGGQIDTKVTSLKASLTRLDTQQTALDSRMATYSTMLHNQYTQLDTLMSTLNTTSSYLTKALAGLEATYTKSN